MKKSLFTLLTLAITFAFFGVVDTTTVSAAERISCPFSSSANTTVVEFGSNAMLLSNTASNHETAKVSVNLPAGDYDVTLVAWDDHSGHGGQGQTLEQYYLKLFDGSTFVQTVGTSADIPENQDSVTSVATLSRIFPGSLQSGLSYITIPNNISSISARHTHVGAGNYQSVYPICAKFVKRSTPVTHSNLSATCSVSDSSLKPGESTTYTAHPTGGNGSYTYQWLDDVLGSNKTEVETYQAEGTYYGRVKVTSGDGQTYTASCPDVKVTDIPVVALEGYCSASDSYVQTGETVTFTAYPSGGTAPYTYEWLSVVSGSGKSVFRSFNSEGSYVAQVRMKDSLGQTLTVPCSTVVVEDDTPPPSYNLNVSCSVNDTSVDEGDIVTFRAHASGGNGPYTYRWSGDITGDDEEETVRFNRDGRYYATVKVTDADGRTETDECPYVTVDDDDDDRDRLRVSCDVSDTRIRVGDSVTFTADVDGGDSPYDYDWRGDINGNDRRETVRFNRAGRYDVTIRVEDDDNNRDSDSCRTVVVEDNYGNVLGASTYTPPTPTVQSVFLNQIPTTGPEDAVKTFLYIFGILVWSTIVVYFVRRNKVQKTNANRIAAFKLQNMKDKGIA